MLGALFSFAFAGIGAGAEPAQPVLKSESFDKDPGWEAHNNRIVPKEYPTIVQDFGSTGRFAVAAEAWQAVQLRRSPG